MVPREGSTVDASLKAGITGAAAEPAASTMPLASELPVPQRFWKTTRNCAYEAR